MVSRAHSSTCSQRYPQKMGTRNAQELITPSNSLTKMHTKTNSAVPHSHELGRSVLGVEVMSENL